MGRIRAWGHRGEWEALGIGWTGTIRTLGAGKRNAAASHHGPAAAFLQPGRAQLLKVISCDPNSPWLSHTSSVTLHEVPQGTSSVVVEALLSGAGQQLFAQK